VGKSGGRIAKPPERGHIPYMSYFPTALTRAERKKNEWGM